MQKLTLTIMAFMANYLAWVGGILPIVLRRSLSAVTKKISADFYIKKPIKNFLSTLEILSLSSKQQFYPISSFSKLRFWCKNWSSQKTKVTFLFNFLIWSNFSIINSLQKIPLSTLKCIFVFHTIEAGF